MAQKRYDNRNRVLRNGEYQKNSGRYEYRYIDKKGVSRSVYSWRLTESDTTPPRKEQTESLREMERRIERDREDGIDTVAAQKTTLNDFFTIYIEERPLKQSTRTNYKYMYRKYISCGLGQKKLSSIKYSDIKRLYHSLIDEKGFKPNSMEVIHTILHPIFETAVRDDYIRKNPTKGVMNEIKSRRDWDKPKRKALTEEQQAAFINYVANSKVYKHWLPIFTVLLGTGCRVGEIIGLRWQDCDFDNSMISINHNLIYRQQDSGKCEFHITTPKTKSGTRVIPMFDEVKETLLAEYEHQSFDGYNRTVIDGYSGFIFQNRFGDVLSAHCINRGIERIYKEYNAEETKKAQSENRPPLLIPHFTVHNLRHTFCTRLCENQSNEVTLKVIQEIMGHADISTTLDVYTDLTTKKKQQAFSCLQGKIKLT